ncbi:unnamed protein product [Coregonus sp. 'balchen']|nr:unnamed protein product [Coregonus sp. 'balchen']
MDHRQLLPDLHGNISSSLGSVNDALLSRTGYTVLAVIIGAFSVPGVCMNVLVIVVTVRHRRLRQPLNYALVNLAVADLGCALFGGLPTMVTNAMGYFSMGRLGCVLEGFAVAFFGIAGLCSVAVIAVDRYVVVCRPMGAVMFQTRHAVGGVVLSWVWSFVWNTPPLFGWGSFELEGVRTSCAPNWYSREPGNIWLPYAAFALSVILDPSLHINPLIATVPISGTVLFLSCCVVGTPGHQNQWALKLIQPCPLSARTHELTCPGAVGVTDVGDDVSVDQVGVCLEGPGLAVALRVHDRRSQCS